MRRSALIVAVTAVAVIALSPLAETAPTKGVVKLKERVSRDVEVPPFDVREVTVSCPRGYRPTGGMELMGALDLVYSTSSACRRGWTVAAGNVTDMAYSFNAGVICAAGKGRVRVRNAMSDGSERRLVTEYKQRVR